MTLKTFGYIAFPIFCLGIYMIQLFPLPWEGVWAYQLTYIFVPASLAILLTLPNFKDYLWNTKGLQMLPMVIALMPFVSLGIFLSASLLQQMLPFPLEPMNQEKFVRAYISQHGTGWFLLFEFCLIPAICEEMLFRGFLLNNLMKQITPFKANLITSILFACSHLSPYFFPFYILLGLFIGWVYLRSSNILVPIIAHAMNNALALGILIYQLQ